VDAAEASVGEDGDDVAGFGLVFDGGDDGFDVRQVETFAAEAGDVGGEFHGIEAVVFGDFVEVRNRGDDGEVGEGEGFGEFVLEDGAAGGVGARLEENPQAAMPEGQACNQKRFLPTPPPAAKASP
jgi:hypothetical protein